jgi:hypothetical protein
MVDKLKTSYELAMERLRAADPAAGKEKPLTSAQKETIAEARRVAAARLAELEILFNDPLKQLRDPAEQEKAEAEYQIDRQRINADLDRAIEAIRSGGHRPGRKSKSQD